MNCLKCGRTLKDQLVFCPDCQADMENYPVKPGTPIQLPSQPKLTPVKKKPARRKKVQKPEERIPRMRSAIRWLIFALVVSLLAFVLTAAMVLMLLDQRNVSDQSIDPSMEAWQENVSRETWVI